MASQRKDRLACALALAALPAGPALAEPRSLNIPSEEAAKSIPEFARQENIQIVAPVSQLHGIKTQAVSGNMELDDALKALLVGTGLEVASNDGVTIVLRRASQRRAVRSRCPTGSRRDCRLPEPSSSPARASFRTPPIRRRR